VRVLNTLPPLDQQLIVWNSAFAVPNWAWVKNQTETIEALRRFATEQNTRIDVRFVTWDRAFADLARPDLSFLEPERDLAGDREQFELKALHWLERLAELHRPARHDVARDDVEDAVDADRVQGRRRSPDRERLAFAQREQAGRVVDVGVGQHDGRDR